jgi:PKD repeat protein
MVREVTEAKPVISSFGGATRGLCYVMVTATNTAGPNTTTKTDYIDVAECQNFPVKDSEGSGYFRTVQEAYDNASEADTIQTQALNFGESLNFNRDIQVTIKGGYDCEYTDNRSDSTIKGSMTISDGTIVVDKLTLQ